MSASLFCALRATVGATHVTTDPDVLASRSIDYTGRYRGRASVLVRPGTAEEVSAVLRTCRDAGAFVTVQGGRTSLVAGTVPEHNDVLLSTERLTCLGEVDTSERRLRVGAGATLADVQRAATAASLTFGVDLASRESATIGGMASTNAGGLRTVRFGDMREQVLGLQVALPDGNLLQRHSEVRSDNTGYDLLSLFVGAEGTLGVISGVDLRLHPIPTHRLTAVCGFSDLNSLVSVARSLREEISIAALELIDGRGATLARHHLDVSVPLPSDWLLLVELLGDSDLTDRLSTTLDEAEMTSEPAVGVDAAAQQRLWQARESLAEVVGLFGPPLKFDVSLPLSAIASFATESAALITDLAPDAVPVLFGHVGEGNLHLNVLRCDAGIEEQLYGEMMNLIAKQGGNVSSEHGIGTRKREYLGMSRQENDIAAMRAIKTAFDPTGYLNPAVLFG